MYNLLSSDPELALFSIFVINNIDVACLQWNRDRSDSILRLDNRMIDKIIRFIKMQDNLILKEKIGNFIDVLSEPYKLDPVFPAALKEKFNYFFQELLVYKIIELKELKELDLNEKINEMLINIALESVEKSYTYKGYNGRQKKIDTFSWNDIYINMYYIIYLSDLSLESKYAENESMKEVFKRLKILYGMNNSENPNKDVSFLSNFSILFELLNDFPQLKRELEQ
nr:hypothetical protein [Enterococcus faecium]